MSLAAYMPAAQEFASVKVAAVGVPPLTLEIFRDCLKDFKVTIDVVPVGVEDVLDQPAFDACILTLGTDKATRFLASLRNSPVNLRCIVYGIGSQEEAVRVSEYGVNALIEAPIGRNIFAALRATYLLLVHRLRRHVRIPIVTSASLETEQRQWSGVTRDVSAGGLNISSAAEVGLGDKLKISFTLPLAASFTLDGIVCWKTESALGVALFNSSRQALLKKWTDDYLFVADPEAAPPSP